MADSSSADSERPEAILDEWYTRHYSAVAVTADGSFFERYMHRAMERHHGSSHHFGRVLEVGGNRGEHLPYVCHAYDRYVLTDLRSPAVSEAVLADPKVTLARCDVSRLPFAAGSFDRLICTCVLHHVDSPLVAATEMRRVVRGGGTVTVLVPTDPGLAYRAGKALTSGRAARRRGIGELHGLVGALDHPNHFRSIYLQLRHVFRRDEVSVDWYPWRVPSVELNAFIVFRARVTPAP